MKIRGPADKEKERWGLQCWALGHAPSWTLKSGPDYMCAACFIMSHDDMMILLQVERACKCTSRTSCNSLVAII